MTQKLKIVSLHCFGSNPSKHATQRYHFKHCAEATSELADWIYPAAPHLLEPQIVYNLLKNDMGCTDAEVEAFGFEEPRCWFRFAGDAYGGLNESMESLAEVCRREQPDGIAGYSNGGGMAQLVAAAREGGHEAFQSIRFLMSFAGSTSPMMQRHLHELIGPDRTQISIPAIIFGALADPLLANAEQMAADVFESCERDIANETRPFANHALPDSPESYARIVKFLRAQRA